MNMNSNGMDGDFPNRSVMRTDRMNILREKDLDKLQEEFLKKNNDKNLSVKLEKFKVNGDAEINTGSNIKKSEDEVILPNPSENLKKKKKDVISLDLNFSQHFLPKNPEASSQDTVEKKSIFKNFISEVKSDLKLNKDTGLPDTFKVDDKFLKANEKLLEKLTQNLKTKEITKKDKIPSTLDKLSNIDIKDDEYKQIHKKNMELISSMSKDELLEYQQTIAGKIPKNLIEKMKGGYFQKKLNEEKLKMEQKKEGMEDIQESEEDVEDEDERHSDEVREIVNKIAINYNGERKLLQQINNTKADSTIDYTKQKFKDIDLNTKYFTLEEIYNLLKSSNEQQIILGLKLVKFFIDDLCDPNSSLNPSIRQQLTEIKIPSILFYLLDHKNINVKTPTLSNFVYLLDKIFKSDVKNFKHNFFYYNNFPASRSIFLHLDTSTIKSEVLNMFTEEENGNVMKIALVCKKLLTQVYQLTDDNIRINIFSFIFYSFYISTSSSESFMKNYKNSEFEHIFKQILIHLFSGEKEMKKNALKFLVKTLVIILLDSPDLIDEYFSFFRKEKLEVLLINNHLNFILSLKGGNREKIDFSLKDIQKISNKLLSDIKIFKNNLIEEEDEVNPIISNKEDIKLLQDTLNSHSDLLGSYLSAEGKLIDDITKLNQIYDLLNSLFIFSHISSKYPKAVKYLSTTEINETTLSHINKILNFYYEFINKLAEEKNKIQFLFLIENFTKMCLSLLKILMRRNSSNYIEAYITNLLLNLPSFFNTHSEHYYYQYLKHLNMFFQRKITKNTKLQEFLKKINFSYDNLSEDLNLYLSSNEDLRKSQFMKKNLPLVIWEKYISKSQNSTSSSLLNEVFWKNQTSKYKSKFLPFSQNFILQILFNDKIYSEVKLNYLVLLIVITYTPEGSNTTMLNFFEIIFKTLIKFKDAIHNNKAEFIFSEYIQNFIISPMINSEKLITLSKNKDTEIMMEMYFNKIENSMSIENEVSFYYKFSILLLILFHNKEIKFSIDNLNLMFYSNFTKISEVINDSVIFLSRKEEIIKLIIDNLSMKNIDLYETLIVSYLKYKGESKGFLSNFIEKLSERFSIEIKSELESAQLYSNYLKGSKEIREKIYSQLIN